MSNDIFLCTIPGGPKVDAGPHENASHFKLAFKHIKF